MRPVYPSRLNRLSESSSKSSIRVVWPVDPSRLIHLYADLFRGSMFTVIRVTCLKTEFSARCGAIFSLSESFVAYPLSLTPVKSVQVFQWPEFIRVFRDRAVTNAVSSPGDTQTPSHCRLLSSPPLSLPLYLSIYLSLAHTYTHRVSISVASKSGKMTRKDSLSLFLSLPLSFLSLSLSLSLSLFLSLSLSLSSLSLSLSLPIYLSMYLPTYLPTYLPIYLPLTHTSCRAFSSCFAR